MMVYVIGNFLMYCFINAFTPGPGNILALNTVTNFGYRKGKPLFLGIFTGYYIVQALCVIFVYSISSILPSVFLMMKYIGAAYILFLAIYIACSKPESGEVNKSASFSRGFILQFVNVKIYLFGVTALTSYVTDYSTSFYVLLACGLLIATIGTIATITWIGIGVLIQSLYLKYFRVINILLSLILLECVYSILIR
ncbi:cysteine transporter [Gallibacterium genomosp. 3]|uniref:Cysteine transporter n=1 Tax=Gallibacterium genomosp. 3 TaxID=505345 RepID=A0A1A7NT37_9PAST|nr:LysE family transporter [Gallibacterium genomosp. 3]OBW92803.1 cysteine transporter [Gallibacterium genomosp. 3]OBX04090.1 cysteine transporter [Gallibacterium genomosp. 3]